jgi:Zn ribbon nucleic-acid-binding protein
MMSERLVCPKCQRPVVIRVDWRAIPYVQCICGYARYNATDLAEREREKVAL